MARTARRKIWFLITVAFFVAFGGADAGRWAQVATDTGGNSYLVNLDKVERISPTVFKLEVRVTGDSGTFEGPWTLDLVNRTVETPEYPSAPFANDSVPAKIALFLKERRFISPTESASTPTGAGHE